MYKRYLPLVGIVTSALLFVVAAAFYPGGTLESADAVGYDWTRHYISTLFAERALNGAVNPSKYFAIPAMLILCVSLAVVFKNLSMKSPSKSLQTIIEIGGIGSMVYAFLAVTTPLHDLLMSIGLLFFVAAAFALLQMLRIMHHTRLVLFGMAALALLAACAIMYYGNVLGNALAVTQKLVFVVCTGWLLTTHFVVFNPRNGS